jgi:hypothetical protein
MVGKTGSTSSTFTNFIDVGSVDEYSSKIAATTATNEKKR